MKGKLQGVGGKENKFHRGVELIGLGGMNGVQEAYNRHINNWIVLDMDIGKYKGL